MATFINLLDLPPRLQDKIMPITESGCWVWTGPLDASGYGLVSWKGKTQRPHRVVYELLVGPIPEGKQLDHLCRVRPCCRPNHTEPVTQHENVLRGLRGGKHLLTHCPQGHPYSGENLRIQRYTCRRGVSRLQRVCKACHRDRQRARYRCDRVAGFVTTPAPVGAG